MIDLLSEKLFPIPILARDVPGRGGNAIHPGSRVSLDQFRDRLGIGRKALESRIRRGKYRRPSLIVDRKYLDEREVAYWVRAEGKQYRSDVLKVVEPDEVATHRALGESLA